LTKINSNQWLKWKVRGGGNCRLDISPLFAAVGAAAVVTGTHPTMYMARGKSIQLFICSHC